VLNVLKIHTSDDEVLAESDTGHWLGRGSRRLGLRGPAGERALARLLAGEDPVSGERRRPGARGRSAAFDLVFRAPKSVSLMEALGAPAIAGQVRIAHDRAVEAAFAYMDRQAAFARRGAGGRRRLETAGLIALAFRRDRSRAQDPLLHTHVIVANMAEDETGRWGAIDTRQLYLHAKTAGYLYQAQLRHELTERLGLDWTPVQNGCSDVLGIPRAAIEAFSGRRRAIRRELQRRGDTSARAAAAAAIATRNDELGEPEPPDVLWRRAVEAGLTPRVLAGVLGRRARRQKRPSIAVLDRELVGADGLTARDSSFTRRDVIQAWCERLPQGAPAGQIEAATDALLSSPFVVARLDADPSARDVIRLRSGQAVAASAERRYSTPEIILLEERITRLARSAHRRRRPGARALARAAGRAHGLHGAELAAVERIVSGGAAIDCVLADERGRWLAVLLAVREALQQAGSGAVGASWSSRGTIRLEQGAMIHSHRTQALADPSHQAWGGIRPGSLLVLAEAELTGARLTERIINGAVAVGARCLVVGATRRLGASDAAGGFRALLLARPPIRLDSDAAVTSVPASPAARTEQLRLF